MAYSAAAIARRRCTGTRKDGQPCRAWAVWDDPRQLCVSHVGRHFTGWINFKRRSRDLPAAYEPCTCAAYAWPHRPAGGLCRWPDPPLYRSTTPAGTHDWPRGRRPSWWESAKVPLSVIRRERRGSH